MNRYSNRFRDHFNYHSINKICLLLLLLLVIGVDFCNLLIIAITYQCRIEQIIINQDIYLLFKITLQLIQPFLIIFIIILNQKLTRKWLLLFGSILIAKIICNVLGLIFQQRLNIFCNFDLKLILKSHVGMNVIETIWIFWVYFCLIKKSQEMENHLNNLQNSDSTQQRSPR